MIAGDEIGRRQVVLAPEVIIERALGEPGLGRHRVDAHAPDAVAVEQLARRGDDAFTRVGHSPRHARMYTDQ